MNKFKRICVFCGSSDSNDPAITEAAKKVGEIFAHDNITLVYGAAKIGVMGTLAKSVLDNNGKIIGIIPEFLKMKEVVHLELTKLITTKTMHQRKMKMQEESDAFIALPGGMGTLEELFEIVTWLQLGLHKKPIGILNVNGFYDELIKLLENMVRTALLSQENFDLLLVDSDPKKLLAKMTDFERPNLTKWLNSDKA